MGTDDDGVARFQGDDAFVHGRGGGIGGGDEGGHHPHGHPHLHKAPLGVLPEDAHGGHIPDALPGDGAAQKVFQHLILPDAVAGFLHRHFCQGLRLGGAGFGDGLADGVQLLLGHFRQLPLGRLGPGYQIPDLLNGLQISVHFLPPFLIL